MFSKAIQISETLVINIDIACELQTVVYQAFTLSEPRGNERYLAGTGTEIASGTPGWAAEE